MNAFVALKNEGQAEFVVQRMAEKLLLGLSRVYTVAVGSKYQFWIMMPNMSSDEDIVREVEKIKELLNQPISNNYARYEISVALGVSIYPNTAQSAKKLITQAEMAIRQALKEKKNQIVYFGD